MKDGAVLIFCVSSHIPAAMTYSWGPPLTNREPSSPLAARRVEGLRGRHRVHVSHLHRRHSLPAQWRLLLRTEEGWVVPSVKSGRGSPLT